MPVSRLPGTASGAALCVPGNHDVPRSSQPSSIVRYRDFTSVWRAAGCVTPWLDGIDAYEQMLLAEAELEQRDQRRMFRDPVHRAG